MTKNHTQFLKQLAAAFPLYHEGEECLYWQYALEQVVPHNRVTVIPSRGPWTVTGKIPPGCVLMTPFYLRDGAAAGTGTPLAFEWVVNAKTGAARYMPVETGLRAVSVRYSPALFIPAILRKSVTGNVGDDIRVSLCRIDMAKLGFSTSDQEQMVKIATQKLAAVIGHSASEIITPLKNRS